ncbi:DNA internalization-related competence protein ComEC/Rec2 [Pantoea rwandensis]|uniref:DNA internalization-related competence protein ComEC/Rec2 n=1 Tax=Pantoea rwandensis TaxID=1076550 RepID=A0A1X1CXW8_9GAMM|nr:DNA internalization-related competence protein ComEC/Rec2 [Pantoea rwandensis]ORM69255.1 DNA internalization-related competence protein ComEC/Rec2 [Pantoea rwandensis]
MRVTWIVLARAVILAALPLTILPQIPSTGTIAMIGAGGLIAGLISRPMLRVIGIALLLLAWMLAEARQVLNAIETLTAAPAEVTLRITEVKPASQQITAQIIRVGDRYQFPPIFATISTTSSEPPFCVGQRWQMKLRLRAVHGRLNEGGFDAQRFALANHTPLQGRIISQHAESLHCSTRSQLIDYHSPVLKGLQQPAILEALAFGERGNLTQIQRQLLRETGTAHLMAISGMHIALAASVGWLAVRGLQVIFPAHYISYSLPLLGSFITAAIYCWISGSHAPAQRAIVALGMWMVMRLAGWQLSGWQIWTLCIGGLLWFDPLTVLSESFWLSALAVAMLIIWFQWFALPARFSKAKRWLPLRLLHLQLGMMILMAPLQIFLFQGISVSAILANLLAVPVVSLITVPLILLALLFPVSSVSAGLWWLADHSVHKVMQGLMLLPDGWWPLNQAWLAMTVLWLGLLLWRSGIIYQLLLPACCVALAFILWRSQTEQDDWQVDMIDIGHGLAIAITQGNEVVMYDAGPRWSKDDAGSRVILPWLHYHGRNLQTVIISHKHLDHQGGLSSLRKANPNVAIRSALADVGHLPCQRGEQWQWGKLTFTALWPLAGNTHGQNNDSCVVRVDDGTISLLLTGDLELEAEKKLVALEKEQLASTFLQVPHHGSRTSSGPLLLRSVAGEAALASVARYNAWRMPAQAVVGRYRQQGYIWYDTAQSGQIHIGIRQGRWQIKGLREQIMPRWYHQWFGVKRDSR